MPGPQVPARSLLVSTVAAGLVQIHRAGRVLGAAARALEGFALSACGPQELSRITDRCYAAAGGADRGLFAWERAWFERDLPAPPAALLLGGCGDGRELRHLTRLGYAVTAFDPVTRRGQDGPSVVQARYEDLLDVHHPGSRAITAAAPFAAAVLGWGSFTHVVSGTDRLAVLRALRHLVNGPVLLSYWAAHGEGAASSRARALGQAVGLRLRPADAPAPDPHDRVAPHCGYAHCFSEPELRALARESGYQLALHSEGYPHATLSPRGGCER